MRWLILVALAACYSPEFAPCSVGCDSGVPCPEDLICGGDLYCHAAGDMATCPTDEFTVSIQKSGTGTGRVTDGQTLDCGSACARTVAAWTMVTLTATEDVGSRLSAWSGPCSGTTPCTFVVNDNQDVGVVFNATRTLSVVFAGPGAGQVTSEPVGLDCIADCGEPFDLDTVVVLSAVADNTSIFIDFTGGGCSGPGPCMVTMSQAVQVTAQFQ